MAERDFGVGIVGWGNAVKLFHAPFVPLVPGLALRAVATRRRAEVAARLPEATVHDTIEGLLTDPQIDLVVVATPHRLHAPHAQAALAAGKHVVVEKPFAAGAAEAEAVFDRARAAGRLCIPFQNRRWDGDFLTVQRLLAAGTLGEVYHVENNWPMHRPALRGVWREDPDALGGVLHDLGPHLIDQTLALFGPPQSVYAQIVARRQGARANDQFRLTLRYASGLTAILATDFLAALPPPRFLLRGTLGAFEKHGLDPQEAALRAGRAPSELDWGTEPPDAWGRLRAMGTDGLTFDGRLATLPGNYRAFYTAVHAALRDGGPSPVAPEDVILQARIIEAALRSAEENKVVEVG